MNQLTNEISLCSTDNLPVKSPVEIVDEIWSNLNWKQINAMAVSPRHKCCEIFECPGKCAVIVPDKVLGYLTSDGKYIATEDEFIMTENLI